MGWITYVVGGIFLICFAVGVYKGAIKIAVSLATTLLTVVISVFATPLVADLITNKTPMDEMIKDQVVSTMAGAATEQVKEGVGFTEDKVKKVLEAAGITEEKLEKQGISVEDIVSGKVDRETLAEYGVSRNLLDGIENAGEEAEKAVEGADIPKGMQFEAIEGAELPEIFKAMLADNNNDAIYKKLGVETFAQYVGTFLARLIIHIVAFLCTFLITAIILRAIVFALDIVANLPVLGFVNRLAGGAVGIGAALVIVWILFIIVTLLYVTEFGQEMYRVIQSNEIMNMIYEYNPLMKIATNFM